MNILLIVFVWWLIGFITALWAMGVFDPQLRHYFTYGDLLLAIVAAMLGPIFGVIFLYQVAADSNLWQKSVFPKKVPDATEHE